MKILHLNDHFQRMGGAETMLFSTLEALDAEGVENAVVHQHPTPLREGRWRLYQVPHLGEVAPPKGALVSEKLEEILRRERPDLVHLYDVGNPRVAQTCLRFVPTLQSVFNHSFYCPGGAKYLPLFGKVCRRPFGAGCLAAAFLTHCNSIRPTALFSSYQRSSQMLRKSRGLLFATLSRYQADCLLQSGCSPQAIKVLPPFADLPDLSKPASLTGDPVVLFSGRVVPGKGLHLLLRALSGLAISFRLIVDGAGPTLESAKGLALRLGLKEKVEFVGWAPPQEHRAYYRQASVVAVPSLWPEPFSLVGIEAMSYAKPVVAFAVGGIPEWLEDGVTGFLIHPGDLTGMAEKIDFLLQNPSVARQMGQEGRQQAEQRFTSRQYVPKLLEIYQQAIDAWGIPHNARYAAGGGAGA